MQETKVKEVKKKVRQRTDAFIDQKYKFLLHLPVMNISLHTFRIVLYVKVAL